MDASKRRISTAGRSRDRPAPASGISKIPHRGDRPTPASGVSKTPHRGDRPTPASGVSKKQAGKILTDFQRNLYIVGKNGEESRPTELILVGSFRRGHEYAEDIDLLAIIRRIPPGLNVVLKPTSKYTVYRYGGKNRHIMLKVHDKKGKRIPIDIFVTLPEEKPFALYHYTGSKQYNIRTRKKAKDAGYRLNQYGLFINNRRSPGLKSEKDIAKRIGVSYRIPSDRET